MKKLVTTVCALISCCVATQASAEAIYFDCDTKSEHFSHIKVGQIGPHYHVGGKITAATLARSDRFAPAASATLASEDGAQSVWVQMIAPLSSKDNVGQGPVALSVMSRVDGGPFNGEQLAKAEMHQTIDFAIDADEGGQATIKFGGVERKLPFHVKGRIVAGVSCSTGQFTFTDLEIMGR